MSQSSFAPARTLPLSLESLGLPTISCPSLVQMPCIHERQRVSTFLGKLTLKFLWLCFGQRSRIPFPSQRSTKVRFLNPTSNTSCLSWELAEELDKHSLLTLRALALTRVPLKAWLLRWWGLLLSLRQRFCIRLSFLIEFTSRQQHHKLCLIHPQIREGQLCILQYSSV